MNRASVHSLLRCWGYGMPILLLMGCSIPFLASERKDSRIDYTFTPGFKPKRIEMSEPLDFRYSPLAGRTEFVRIFSKTISRTFSENQLLHEREEGVDFTLKSEVKAVDAPSGMRKVLVETVRKDGPTDLYDLGYPELGESIEYQYSQKAEVKKAGSFPTTSVFFLPPISLPKRPVEVGETWVYSGQWISLRNGLPMSVEIMSILKGVFSCGDKSLCAEIEISGEVKVPKSLSEKADLRSQIVGRLLYNLQNGSVVWSDIRNKERVQQGTNYMEIQTCTESLLEQPTEERWVWRARAQCDPNRDLPVVVPGA